MLGPQHFVLGQGEANRPDYYTRAERGVRDETAEKLLQNIESRVAPVIRKLANPQFHPPPEMASELYLFLAFMSTRVALTGILCAASEACRDCFPHCRI